MTLYLGLFLDPIGKHRSSNNEVFSVQVTPQPNSKGKQTGPRYFLNRFDKRLFEPFLATMKPADHVPQSPPINKDH